MVGVRIRHGENELRARTQERATLGLLADQAFFAAEVGLPSPSVPRGCHFGTGCDEDCAAVEACLRVLVGDV